MSRACLGALAAVLLAGCGAGSGPSDRARDPFTEIGEEVAERPDNASPRWERVATLAGSGPATERFAIVRDAIQWRARWECQSGRLRLTRTRHPLAESRCPRRGIATDVRTGALELAVEASGPWRVVVEQQVDTPLHERPLAAMRSPRARVIARGRFYGLERRGRGRSSLYELPSGRLALRFDDFATAPNTDLFVWASTARRPRNTVQAARAPHTVVRALKSTAGDQNYLLPAGLRAADVRSVVIWCVPVRIAYAAARLVPAASR